MADEKGLKGQIEGITSSGNVPVILPCDAKDFGDFIAGLFRSQQTINRYFSGQFIIGSEEIKNIYHLLEQRISQQNDAKLVAFSVSINFDDASTVKLNSFLDFERYNELKPIISTAVTLNWTYLIRFQGSRIPERQVIDLTFNAEEKGHAFVIRDGIPWPVLSSPWTGTGAALRIEHTLRSWGTDIESLLTNHLQVLLKQPVGLRRLISKNSGTIGFLTFLVFFALCLGGSFLGTRLFVENQLAAAQQAMSTTSDLTVSLAAKLDFLISTAAQGVWPKFVLYLLTGILVGFFLSVVLGIGASALAENLEQRSLLVLTKQSEALRARQIVRETRSTRIFWITSIVGVATGVIANIIFVYGFQKWIG